LGKTGGFGHVDDDGGSIAGTDTRATDELQAAMQSKSASAGTRRRTPKAYGYCVSGAFGDSEDFRTPRLDVRVKERVGSRDPAAGNFVHAAAAGELREGEAAQVDGA